MINLYDECHRLFNYDTETGLLTRKVSVCRKGGRPHNNPNTSAGRVVGSHDCCDGYLVTKINGKKYSVHSIVWLMQKGAMPTNFIDHINGIKDDNRFCNLREATNAENQRNQGKNKTNTTGFKGVSICKRKNTPYMSMIRADGQKVFLGRFASAELAYDAYCLAAKKYHGEFARVA